MAAQIGGAPVLVLPAAGIGGTERVASFLFQEFVAINPATTLVVCMGPPDSDLAQVGRAHFLGKSSTLRAALAIARLPEVRAGRPLLVFQTGTSVLLAALKQAGIIRSRLVVRSPTHLSSLWASKRGPAEVLFASLLRIPDLHICQSESIRSDLVSRWGVRREHVVTIPNPVTRTAISQTTEQASRPYAIVVGNLRPEKGHVRLVERLASVGFPIDLVLVGNGSEYAAIVEAATRLHVSNRIRFVHDCTDPMPLISSAAMLFCASYFEGFPNAVLEAAVAGVPVIGFSDCDVLHEILEDGAGGLLVDPCDASELSEAVERILSGAFTPDWDPVIRRHEPSHVVRQYWNAVQGA